jgi:predicted RNase H-like HicB family nuclease
MLKYTVLIEKDQDGFYVADVPELPGCHTQAKNLNELNKRIKEAISLYLEARKTNKLYKKHLIEFMGVQLVEA